MNTHSAKALFLDAIYQVLDNWVFRILVVLCGVVVLATFAVGFREDEIVLLFGLRRWPYDGIATFLGMAEIGEAQTRIIDLVVSTIFGQLAGNFGVIFCIAATAFFVPRMIEKGAADVLFHKPLRRLTFYLHRYFAGLLFVAVLSTLMAVGIYLGLLLVSGWHDPGILLAAPLLTYIFALVYVVSMLVGVFTRSTVAAILLTTLFFVFNGCVHSTWVLVEFSAQYRLGAEGEGPLGEEEEGANEQEEVDVESTTDSWLIALGRILSAVHYVLPKTSDADVMASKLRRAVDPPEFLDDLELFSLFELPDGFRSVEPVRPDVSPQVAAALGEPVIALEGSIDAGAVVRYTLLARPFEQREVERRDGTKLVRETRSGAASSLRGLFDDASRSFETFGVNPKGRPMSAAVVAWTAAEGVPGQALVIEGAEGERLFTVWIEDASGDDSAERRAAVRERLSAVCGLAHRIDPYERSFTLDAPWRYNILFSVGSSLAFVLILLLLGSWKLSRIEF